MPRWGWLVRASGADERCGAGYRLCACKAIPFDESDSQVKVNCVLVGVVCCSSKLVPPWPRGGEEKAAAFAMAAEMIPWSDFAVGSPKHRVSENHRDVLNSKGEG
jgi:hypothetical protein